MRGRARETSSLGYYARRLAIDVQRRVGYRLVVPRLGSFAHHMPRPLRIPAHYAGSRRPSSPPRISIVMPSLNQGAYVAQAIESILVQGYPNLELIVQDGGSSDRTVEVLERHAEQIHHWESAPDGGQANAINRGFARSTGEIMAYLNSDDRLLPGSLNYVTRHFEEHPDVDIVYGHRILIDHNDDEIGRWVLPGHDDEVLSWADFVPQETLFWRRRIWERVDGALDESFQFAMDWDLLLRFRDARGRFVRLPRFLGAFRVHPWQKSSAQMAEVGRSEMDILRQRVLGYTPERDEICDRIAPYIARHLVIHCLFLTRLLRF